MNGREMIAAALSPEGTGEIAAVICYEDIYVRDHWAALTSLPWWEVHSPDLGRQVAWRRAVIAATPQNWFVLPAFLAGRERQRWRLEVRGDGVYLVGPGGVAAVRLEEPAVAGWNRDGAVESLHPSRPPTTPEEIDAAVPLPASAPDPTRGDLATLLLAEFGRQLYPIRQISSPLWSCYNLWGFEGLMEMVATRPDLVRRASQRFLQGSLAAVREARDHGVAAVWIEECLTDMISPIAFRTLNLPVLRALVEEVRAAGLHSIYYYCGDPAGKWREILDAGADALSLEESKKGFAIDVADVVSSVAGRCAVLGNLDAIQLLPHAPEGALRAEIARQLAAGRRNGGRFVMSLGSPVTPGTRVERVRLYCDLVHEMGKR